MSFLSFRMGDSVSLIVYAQKMNFDGYVCQLLPVNIENLFLYYRNILVDMIIRDLLYPLATRIHS